MKKRTIPFLLTAILLLLFPVVLKAQYQQIVIGDDESSTSTNLLPVSTGYNYSVTQQIFTADEINCPNGGTITYLSFFHPVDYGIFSMNGVKVYMKNVNKDHFESNTDMVPVTENDKVWEGTFTNSVDFTLNTPFFYDGTSNLLICIYDPTSGYPGSIRKFMTTSTTSSHPGQSLALAYYSNSAVPNMNNLSAYSGTKTLFNYRNTILFEIYPKISGAYVQGFSEPVLGGHPDYTWSVPSDANYHINTNASYWQDATTNSTLSAQDVFDQEGHDYVLTYHFSCDPGYRFSDNAGVQIEGFSDDILDEVGMDATGLFARTIPFRLHSGNTLNDGNATNSTIPVNGQHVDAYTKSEFVIPAEKLGNLINNTDITDMTFYAHSGYQNLTWQGTQFKVFLKEVESAKINDFSGYEDATVVYEGPLSIVDGEMIINFSTPYTYYGGHLLIGIYNTSLGESHSCVWNGILSTGSSIQGFSPISSDIVFPTQQNFLPMVTFGVAPAPDPATIVQIGYGGGSSYSIPTVVAHKYTLTEEIYTAEEIGRSGNIYSVAFYNLGDTVTRNFDIYMMHTSQSSFDGNWVPVTSANRVFSGNVHFRPNDWTTIELSAPFAYNGTGNLMLVVDDNTGTSTSFRRFRVFNASGQVLSCYSDNINPNPSNMSGYYVSAVTGKNQILLGFAPILCHTPTGLAVSNIDTTSATLSWTENNGGHEWQICVNGNEANAITVTTNPYTLTGLSPHTSYTVKVRTNCGGSNGKSEWSIMQRFTTTSSGPDPYVQVSIGSGDALSIDLPTTTRYNYCLSQQIYTAEEIGQEGDIYSLSFYNTSNSATRNLDIYMVHTNKTEFSDNFDWVPVTTDDLVFSGDVNFRYNDWSTIGLNTPFAYNGYDNIAILVDDNSGSGLIDNRYFKIIYTHNQCMFYYSSDTDYDPTNLGNQYGAIPPEKNQIQIGLVATRCLMPKNFSFSTVGPTSATLSWTESGTANEWQICVNGDESNLVHVTTNPYTLTGLTPEAHYTVKVRANCGVDGTSYWSNEVSFTTEAVPDTSHIHIGDGTSANVFLPTYTNSNYSLTEQIYTTAEIGQMGDICNIAFYNTGNATTRNLDIYMVHTDMNIFYSSIGWVNVTAADLVFSGDVDFVSDGWTKIEFPTPFFYNGFDNLLIAVDDNTGTRTNAVSFRTFASQTQAISTHSNITNYDPYNANSILGFTDFNFKNQIQLDILPIECQAPISLTVSHVGPQIATLSWTAPDRAHRWEYQQSTSPDFSENLVVGITNDTTVQLSYLNVGTTYYLRVRSLCGSAETSDWSDTVSFRTFLPSIQIGSGNSNFHTSLPTNTGYNYSMSEQLYTAAEIGQAGLITSVGFYNISSATFTRNLDIYMVHSNHYNVNIWTGVTASDLVFSGEVTFENNMWTTIEFPVPFNYNGIDNLLIAVDDNTGDHDQNMIFRTFTAYSASKYIYGNDENYDPESFNDTYIITAARNQIKLDFQLSMCQKPTDLTVSIISKNSATLSWTDPGDGYEWEYQYSTSPDFPATTPSFFATGVTNAQLTGLIPNITYYVRVRTNCGEFYSSEWSDTISFILPSEPGTLVQIGEGTSTSNDLPIYIWYNYSMSQQIYTVSEIGRSGDIYSISFYKVGNAATRNLDIYMTHTDKTYFMYGGDMVPVTAADRVFSGSVHFQSDGWTTIGLPIPFAYNGFDNLLLVVDDNTGTYVSQPQFRTFSAQKQAICDYDFETNYDPTDSSNYYRTVKNVKNQIQLGFTPTGCLPPTSLTLSNIGTTSATLSWTETGTANEWQICLNGNEASLINVTTNSYTLNELDPGVDYTVKIRSNCDVNITSPWSDEVSFTTDMIPPYFFILGDDSICPNQTTVLSVNTNLGTHYLWSTGETSQTITVPVGEYSVTVTNNNSETVAFGDFNVMEKTTYDITVSDAVCASELPYVWNGDPYDASGSYSKTFTAANGCDSTVTLVLTVNQPTTGDTAAVACESFIWRGTNYTQSGDYTAQLTNAAGCDSVLTLHLTVNPSYAVSDTKTVCQSALPYLWNGVTFNGAGTQEVMLQTVDGCDSVVTMTLVVNTAYQEDLEVTACNSYEWNGQTYTVSGDYDKSFSAANGCDSIVTLHLTINQPTTGDTTVVACESFTWRGTTYTQSGDYTALLTNAAGCDSVLTLHLTINPSYAVSDTKTVCQSALPYLWNGVTFNGAGTQEVMLQTVDGCDSVVTMTLVVNTAYQEDLEVTACNSYEWNGQTYTVSGDYDKSFSAANGCDSIVTLHLTINQPTTGDTAAVACESFIWRGTNYTQSGDYTAQLANAAGCDSVLTLHLTVNPSYAVSDTKTVCQSALPYLWNGVTFNGAGTQEVMLQTVDGCDSVVTMTLVVNTAYQEDLEVTACNSYEWNGQTYTVSGNYDKSFSAANGCDSIVTLHLTINQPTSGDTAAVACESFIWRDATYTQSGDYTAQLTNAAGCDSVLTLHLTINEPTTGDTTAVACESFIWRDATYTQSGDYTAQLTNAAGCDSVVTLHLTINEPTTGDTTAVACESFIWRGTTYTQSGDYTAQLTNAAGCDSVQTLHLTINEPTTGDTAAVACESFTWRGTTYTQSGDYTAQLTNAAGCDSVLTLHLTINEPTFGDTAAVACESFIWRGTTYTQSGDYTAQLTNAAGCDSVLTLHLTINQPTTGDTAAVACESFIWRGTTYTQSGDYTAQLTNAAGCDSVLTLHLTINEPTFGDTAAVACESFIWRGTTYTQSGDYTAQLTNAVGCDSVLTLHLTIHPTYNTPVSAEICQGGSYVFFGQTLTQAGVYSHTLQSVNGCDSVVTLTLTVHPFTYTQLFDTICEGTSYNFFEQTLTQTGVYAHTLQTQYGCDSLVTLSLTVKPSTHTDLMAEECGSYFWNGNTYTQSGNYSMTFTAANGCDSVVTLHLTIHPTYNTPVSAEICQGGSYEFFGQTFTQTGVYSHTLQSVNGCDSVVTLTLTVHPFTYTQLFDTICEGTSYNFFEQTLTQTGVYAHTLQTQYGCDSLVTLSLTVKPSLHTELTAEECGSYFWNGNTYTQSGNYSMTFTAANGCDSVVTLHLTIHQPTTGDTTVVACESFTWRGITYTQSGDYTALLTNAVGCDSVLTLHLTVNQPTTGDTTVVACENFSWYGNTYTQSGDYTVLLTNMGGCDSVLTLHLTVNQPTTGDTSAVACENFTWYGTTYTQSGDYTVLLSNAVGCDSVVTLHLTIYNPAYTVETVSACGSYFWNNVNYTESGDYMLTYTAANGCDSVVTLHLTIHQSMQTDLYVTACDSYTWENGNTYTQSNDYAMALTAANGCDSIVVLHLTILQSAHTDLYETACDSYTWVDGNTYTQSDDYAMTLTAANGCDSVVILHLTIQQPTTSEFTIETPDSCYTWNGQTYCASGDYVQTLTAANGCDSTVTLHLTTRVGVENHEVTAIYLAPNPTKNVFRIVGLEIEPEFVDLYDLRGKLVMHASESELDVTLLPTGMYMVKVFTGDRVISLKLIKQ